MVSMVNKALIMIVLSAMAVNVLEKFSTSLAVYGYGYIEVKTGFVKSSGIQINCLLIYRP